MPHRILSLATDPSLITLREMVLKTAGYEVMSATSLIQVDQALETGDFDLVLISHTITEKEKRRIATRLRDLGTAADVLELCFISPEIPDVDHWMIESDPQALLDKIKDIFEGRKAAYRKAQQ